ncbi:MAG: hypothetical protein HOK21_25405 [Rhodospirillaceae bacterium]|jgi:hypothetical protein|nr:hypothetical protein [Rhodospirillaceae bacterium]MBT5527435.1 hypothetical protein [Rhodospirillaceae bacterium]MBT5880724.1 hypothetical protein [Rhodospirillaceae bacterium]MBT6983336.1 hypothetical protein [Rhodospirillaceae bacterium]
MYRKSFLMAIFSIAIFFSLVWGGNNVDAQGTVHVTAVGSIDYSIFSSETKKLAIYEAKKIALKKYVAKLPTAKKRQLKSFEQEFYNSVDDFVLETKVQQDKDDKTTKTYKVVIVATIDPGAIDAFFIDNSAAGNQLAGDASDFGAMFIARQEVSRQSYDAKRTSVSGTESSASLQEESASNGTTSIDSSRTKSLTVKRTGGSTVRKRDNVSYEPSIEISEEVAYAVEEQLVDAGFEPMGIDELDNVPLLDEIIGKMKKSGRLPKRIEKSYKRAAIDAGWSFLGMGIIDIGAPTNDAARGTVKVLAKISFKVWMLTDGRAKTVASVRPQAVYGQGGDASIAQTNAYNDAVKVAMDTVVAQLQKKGLR